MFCDGEIANAPTHSARRIFSRRGPIYLDEEIVTRPLSIQADEGDTILAAMSEKAAMNDL
jgi:hypothetical protein